MFAGWWALSPSASIGNRNQESIRHLCVPSDDRSQVVDSSFACSQRQKDVALRKTAETSIAYVEAPSGASWHGPRGPARVSLSALGLRTAQPGADCRAVRHHFYFKQPSSPDPVHLSIYHPPCRATRPHKNPRRRMVRRVSSYWCFATGLTQGSRRQMPRQRPPNPLPEQQRNTLKRRRHPRCRLASTRVRMRLWNPWPSVAMEHPRKRRTSTSTRRSRCYGGCSPISIM